MGELWTSITDILMVVIPTIVGAVSSKYIVNSWQEKKEKFKLDKEKFNLRKEIIEGYQKSQIKKFIILYRFLIEIFDYYHSPSGINKDGTIVFSSTFSDKTEQQPLALYSKKLKEIVNQFNELTYEEWNFFSIVNVYYDDKKLQDDLFLLYAKTYEMLSSLSLLIHSKNKEEFEKNYDVSDKILNVVKILQTTIASMLAVSEIRKPIG